MASGLSRGSLFMPRSASSQSSLEAGMRGHGEVDEVQHSRRARAVDPIRVARGQRKCCAALGRRKNAPRAAASRTNETASLRVDERRLVVGTSPPASNAALQLEAPAHRREDREAGASELGPRDRRRRTASVESIEQIDQHAPTRRLRGAKGEDMPRPPKRDGGGIERLEIAHHALAQAHQARLLQRRELLALIFDEHVDRVNRLERAAEALGAFARSASHDAELAEALGHERGHDVAFPNIYGTDDERVALEQRHTVIVRVSSALV